MILDVTSSPPFVFGKIFRVIRIYFKIASNISKGFLTRQTVPYGITVGKSDIVNRLSL